MPENEITINIRSRRLLFNRLCGLFYIRIGAKNRLLIGHILGRFFRAEWETA